MQLSAAIVEFYLIFYDGHVDMLIWAILTRSQGRVSDTQVTVKIQWSLVFLLKVKLKLANGMKRGGCVFIVSKYVSHRVS